MHFLTGIENREEYLLKNFRYYPIFQYINNELAKDAKIMLIYTNMSYYCDRSYIYDSYHSGYTLRKILQESHNTAEGWKRFSQLGISHVFLDHTFMEKDFTSVGLQLQSFTDFSKQYLIPLVKSGDVMLYQLR